MLLWALPLWSYLAPNVHTIQCSSQYLVGNKLGWTLFTDGCNFWLICNICSSTWSDSCLCLSDFGFFSNHGFDVLSCQNGTDIMYRHVEETSVTDHPDLQSPLRYINQLTASLTLSLSHEIKTLFYHSDTYLCLLILRTTLLLQNDLPILRYCYDQ